MLLHTCHAITSAMTTINQFSSLRLPVVHNLHCLGSRAPLRHYRALKVMKIAHSPSESHVSICRLPAGQKLQVVELFGVQRSTPTTLTLLLLAYTKDGSAVNGLTTLTSVSLTSKLTAHGQQFQKGTLNMMAPSPIHLQEAQCWFLPIAIFTSQS